MTFVAFLAVLVYWLIASVLFHAGFAILFAAMDYLMQIPVIGAVLKFIFYSPKADDIGIWSVIITSSFGSCYAAELAYKRMMPRYKKANFEWVVKAFCFVVVAVFAGLAIYFYVNDKIPLVSMLDSIATAAGAVYAARGCFASHQIDMKVQNES